MAFTSEVQRGLDFIGKLRDEGGDSYYEVAELDHTQRQIFPQTQYVLYVTFKKLGLTQLAEGIAGRHDFTQPDKVDTTRKLRPANDTYCVLDGELKPFRLAGQKWSDYSDEMALEAIFWLEKSKSRLGKILHRKKAEELWKQLRSRYDTSKGILKMDKADAGGKSPLYSVYKLALFGLLAKKVDDQGILAKVQQTLRDWQHKDGGWETDRTVELAPHGVANLETTALAILVLADP